MFCTYCGKRFKRKEHLERHIPSHTNIKPHRCVYCQLSFARRDLLQRHYHAYHVVQEETAPSPGGVPNFHGRSPIACLQCAEAKTGCNKGNPCYRCEKRGLECVPRFARRISKLAVRASKLADEKQGQEVKENRPELPPSRMDRSSLGRLSPSEISDTESASTKVAPGDCHIYGGHENDYSLNWNTKRNIYIESCLHLGADMGVPGSELPGFGASSVFPYYSPEIEPSLSQNQLHTPPMSLINSQDDLQYLQTLLEIPSPALGPSPPALEMETASLGSGSLIENLTPMAEARKTSTTLTSVDHSKVQGLEFHHVLLAAEASWPLANCLPRTSPCPKTSIAHLECLERIMNDEGIWSLIEENLGDLDQLGSHADVQGLPLIPTLVNPLNSWAREKLLAHTQSLLRRALEVHLGAKDELSPTSSNSVSTVLPPNKALEYFLRSCVRGLAQFYPATSQASVDPNEMLLDSNRSANLLVLLMIAHGAARLPTSEAQCLYLGLTELCRSALCEALERSPSLSTDRVTLQCALLLCINCAWSGDKWMMDFALGRISTNLAMLKQAGMLAPSQVHMPDVTSSMAFELQWQIWLRREHQNRLACNFLILDHELSLFSDSALSLTILELQNNIPGPEALSKASNSAEWEDVLTKSSEMREVAFSRCSVYDLFQEFLKGDLLSIRGNILGPYHLRLLLYPLHSLVTHLTQLLSFAPLGAPGQRTWSSRTVSMNLQLEETTRLLQQWYKMAMYLCADVDCPVWRTNFVLYHLSALNLAVSIPDVESAARAESDQPQCETITPALACQLAIRDFADAVFHSRQILQHLVAILPSLRPCWWSLALYRATIALWACAMTRGTFEGSNANTVNVFGSGSLRMSSLFSGNKPSWRGQMALPVYDEGGIVSLESAGGVLIHGLTVLGHQEASNLSQGVYRKIVGLGIRWGQLGYDGSGVLKPL